MGNVMSDDFDVPLEKLANWEYKRLKARDLAAQHLAEEKRQAANARSRQDDGEELFMNLPDQPPALWGEDSQILWADGEPLMIAGDDGTGKTTVVHQLMAARLGQFDSVLNHAVAPARGRILYLAMDRPQQARRAGHRIFKLMDRDVLQKRLVAWVGPLPVDILKSPGTLADWIAEEFGTDITEVYADSYKDLAAKISDDAVGAGINSAIQEVIARGVNWVGLHHPKKAQDTNKTPNTLADMYGSRWLTAGHGSVLFLERQKDQTDNDVIQVKQLKEPMDKMAPMVARHDRTTGLTHFVSSVQSAAAMASSDRRARITAYVLSGGPQGREQKDICAIIGGRKESVIKELHDMHATQDLKLKVVNRSNIWWDPSHAPGDAV